MASRAACLLVGATLAVALLPGCLPVQVQRSTSRDADAVTDYTLPPDPVPVADRKDDKPAVPTRGTVVGLPEAKMGDPPPEAPQPKTGPEPDPTIARPMYPQAEPPPAKRAPLVEALQCVLDDRHQEALKHLQAYDAETQEFYLRVLPTLTIFARKRIDELSAAEVAVLNEQLQSLLATLRPRTELVIDKMCYCEWVKSYGIYRPLAEGHAFVAAERPDEPGELVRLYVELRNFASMPHGNVFETRLSSAMEIRDGQGQKVKEFRFADGDEPLRSLTRLTDYYNTYTFPVPNLPPGTYQLVLRIADETVPGGRRVAEKTLEFRVTPVAARSH